MNLTINGRKVKASTLALLGIIIAGAATSQIKAVNDFLSYHPRLAPLGQWVIALIMLLHSPFGQSIIQALFGEPATTPSVPPTSNGK